MMRLACCILTMSTFLLSGCLETSAGNVTGTVMGSTFDVMSGSAEREGSTFTITLADTNEFSCTATGPLPSAFLTIVLTDIGPDAQDYDAAGVVFFNTSVDNVADGEGADMGSLTIISVDETVGRIEGSVDASGPNSAVEGDFKVDICN